MQCGFDTGGGSCVEAGLGDDGGILAKIVAVRRNANFGAKLLEFSHCNLNHGLAVELEKSFVLTHAGAFATSQYEAMYG